MTSKQKLGALQHSINQAEMGLTKIVHCPYCNTDLDFSPPQMVTLTDDPNIAENFRVGHIKKAGPGELFDKEWQPPTCCEAFALATIAILQRKELTEAKDLASRIRSNAGGLPVFN